MARNLHKFVNHSFLKTVDLPLIHRLLAPLAGNLGSLYPATLNGPPASARQALIEFFAGPEENYPEALIDDLHRIAELGTENGLTLLLEQARRLGIDLIPPEEACAPGDGRNLGPKHVALRAYLEHRQVFDEAADMLALQTPTAPAEFAGLDEGVEAVLTDATRAEFEQRARQLFVAELKGRYCRVGWYPDGDDTNIVITHGSTTVTVAVVDNDAEKTMSYRGVTHDVLSYNALTGQIKVGGSSRSARPRLAGLFAEVMLKRPDFFNHQDSSHLYTLAPVERQGFGFVVDHAWDPGVRRCAITEVQVVRIVPPVAGPRTAKPWTITVADPDNALARLGEVVRQIELGSASYHLNYLKLTVTLDGRKRPQRVTVKIKPPNVQGNRVNG